MARWWGRVLYRRPRILGDAWWECDARRKGERPVGLPRWVSSRVVRVFNTEPRRRRARLDSGEVSLRCFSFLEPGPIGERDGGNIFPFGWPIQQARMAEITTVGWNREGHLRSSTGRPVCNPFCFGMLDCVMVKCNSVHSYKN